MTRTEHIAWCKKRALEFVDLGDLEGALSSMASDLMKHPDTQQHAGIQLGMMLAVAGHLSTPQKVREFIEGFK